jgi:hypothetical protein
LILLSGFYASLRSSEIVALTWSDLIFAEEGILLNIAFSKTNRAGIGSVKLLPKNEEKAICPVFYFTNNKKQLADSTGRLFRQFQSGKFIKTPLGKHSIAAVPQGIAAFLKLDSLQSYTGH